MPIDFSLRDTETLEALLRFQMEPAPAGKPFPRWLSLCGHVSRTGGVCADCLRAELKLRGAAVKTEGSTR